MSSVNRIKKDMLTIYQCGLLSKYSTPKKVRIVSLLSLSMLNDRHDDNIWSIKSKHHNTSPTSFWIECSSIQISIDAKSFDISLPISSVNDHPLETDMELFLHAKASDSIYKLIDWDDSREYLEAHIY